MLYSLGQRKENGVFLNQFTNTYQVDPMCKTAVLVVHSPVTVRFMLHSCNVTTVDINFVLGVILQVLKVKRIKGDAEINFSVHNLILKRLVHPYSGVIRKGQC